MDVFIHHFWYIAGTFALGIIVGYKYGEQLVGLSKRTLNLLWKRA